MTDGRGGKRPNSGGVRPGAGRPKQEARDEFDRLVKKAIPAQSMEVILTTLAAEAMAGNLKAAQIVLGYWAGTPIQRQEIKTESQEQKVIIEFERAATPRSRDGKPDAGTE